MEPIIIPIQIRIELILEAPEGPETSQDAPEEPAKAEEPKREKMPKTHTCKSCGKEYVHWARYLSHAATCQGTPEQPEAPKPAGTREEKIKELTAYALEHNIPLSQSCRDHNIPYQGEMVTIAKKFGYQPWRQRKHHIKQKKPEKPEDPQDRLNKDNAYMASLKDEPESEADEHPADHKKYGKPKCCMCHTAEVDNEGDMCWGCEANFDRHHNDME